MKSDKNHLSLPPGMRVFVDRINGRLIFKLENISGYFLGSPSTRGGNCCFHCGSATYRHKSSNDTRRGACLSCRIYECDADEKPCVIHVNLLNHYPVAKGPALEFRYNDKVAICHKISSWRYSSPRYYIQSPDFKFHFSDKGLWDAIKDARLYFSTHGFSKTVKNILRILDHYGELGCLQLNQGAPLSDTHLFIIAYSFLVLNPFDYPS